MPKAAEQILDEALALIGENGWLNTSLADMAAASEISVTVFLRHYPSRIAVLDAFADRVDLDFLDCADEIDRTESLSERLFEALMLRFDGMREHKNAIRAIVHDILRQPLEAICRTRRLTRSIELTLEAVGFKGSGTSGLIYVNAVALIYLDVLRVWLDDDSGDMGKTMSALNHRLKQASFLFKGHFSYFSSVDTRESGQGEAKTN